MADNYENVHIIATNIQSVLVKSGLTPQSWIF